MATPSKCAVSAVATPHLGGLKGDRGISKWHDRARGAGLVRGIFSTPRRLTASIFGAGSHHLPLLITNPHPFKRLLGLWCPPCHQKSIQHLRYSSNELPHKLFGGGASAETSKIRRFPQQLSSGRLLAPPHSRRALVVAAAPPWRSCGPPNLPAEPR